MLSKGILVEVIKKSRSKNAPTVGMTGVVFWFGCNKWNTCTVGFLTADGKKMWATEKSIKIIDENPGEEWSLEKFNKLNATPLICIVLAKKRHAAHVQFLHTQSTEWMPYSKVSELVDANIGDCISVLIPDWLVRKNHL